MLELESSYVYNNEASDQGGGLYVSASGSATCVDGGVYTNTASSGGGAYLAYLAGTYGSLTVSTCDFGTGGSANAPEDVAAAYTSGGSTHTYSSYSTYATFTCTDGTCAP